MFSLFLVFLLVEFIFKFNFVILVYLFLFAFLISLFAFFILFQFFFCSFNPFFAFTLFFFLILFFCIFFHPLSSVFFSDSFLSSFPSLARLLLGLDLLILSQVKSTATSRLWKRVLKVGLCMKSVLLLL